MDLGKILFVDDDDDILFYYTRLIKKLYGEAFLVDSCIGGEDGLSYLKTAQRAPDLMFLDLNMPGMNAWEFLERYVELTPKGMTKVVILTTSINPEDIKKAEQHPYVDRFMNKYEDNTEIVAVLEEYFPVLKLNEK